MIKTDHTRVRGNPRLADDDTALAALFAILLLIGMAFIGLIAWAAIALVIQ